MADAPFPPRPVSRGWHAAFTALPLEHAPDAAWSRLAAALPVAPPASQAPPRRRRAWHVLAAAASIAAAAPLAWWLTTAETVVEPRRAQLPLVSTPLPANRSTERATVARESTRAQSPHVELAAAEPQAAPASERAASSGAPANVLPPAVSESSVAAADASSPTNPPSAAPTRLDALRQESARLEALVAYARDDRMTSATAAVMSASLDDRLRLIDAALMQPDLADDARSSLWDQRVATLQELAALEGTQRWMAAHGTSMDAVARVD